jgi:hypothetical protein
LKDDALRDRVKKLVCEEKLPTKVRSPIAHDLTVSGEMLIFIPYRKFLKSSQRKGLLCPTLRCAGCAKIWGSSFEMTIL